MRAPLRTRRARIVLACASAFGVLSALAPSVSAACSASAPWSSLPETGAHLLEPIPLILAGGAVVAPLALAPTGGDHELRLVAQRRLGGSYDPEPVSVLAPYVLTGGLVVGFGVAAAFDLCEAQRPQAAMLQAVFLTAGTVLLLKLGTGRTWPNGGIDPNAADRLDHPEWAERFRPWREGVAAWPSGHTAVMVAAAAALRASAPELGWARWIGYPLAAGVAAGMWLGDHHWASDILSGALLGEAIGGSVGRSFAPSGAEAILSLVPQPGGAALVYGGVW